ncbi:hypothetical protein FACS1894166_08870 [Bacilli bacterium]|nr:hypothetical protein FACS1894166_08870 [Bacilli bacterium]
MRNKAKEVTINKKIEPQVSIPDSVLNHSNPKTISKHEAYKNKTRVPVLFTHKYFMSDIQEYKSMTVKPILFVRGLSKRYFGKKNPAVQKISFDVFPGEFHAFIGANGAGKTTTIKCLIGAYAN